jgi:hypothetical protein
MDMQIDQNKMSTEAGIEAAQKRFDANREILIKLMDAAQASKEGVDNTDAKRRLATALRIVGQFGIAQIDLAAELGKAEEVMENSPTGTIGTPQDTISPQMI